jgi:hypothetical protein
MSEKVSSNAFFLYLKLNNKSTGKEKIPPGMEVHDYNPSTQRMRQEV